MRSNPFADLAGVSPNEALDAVDTGVNSDDTAEGAMGEIKPGDRDSLIQYILSDLKRNDEVTPVKTADQRRADIKGYREQLEEDSGPDIYGPMKAQLESQEKDRAGTLSQGQGMALLQAAGAMLKGSNFARGAGEAASTYAQAYGQALQADKAEKRSIASMQFNLADAQRKERMGNTRAAMAAEESARKAEADVKRAQNAGYSAKARMAQAVLVGTRPPTTRAGAQISPFNAIVAAQRALAADPTNPKLQQDLKNVEDAARQTKTSFSMSDIPAGGKKADIAQQGIDEKVLARQSRENIAATTALNKLKNIHKAEWRKLVEAANGDAVKAEATYKKSWLTQNPGSGAEDFDPATAQPTMPTRAGSAPLPPPGFKPVPQ